MSQSELRNFEKSMAYHLAPAMLGIKPACLMSMEKNKDGLEENVELFNSRAYTKGMKLTVLCECKSRKLLFLYNGRISASEDFPDEIGLFLGYPVDDVTGFIQNKGRNYLLCGYWKVYSDENRARRIFSNYDKCRNYLCNKLAQGESIYQALKIS